MHEWREPIDGRPGRPPTVRGGDDWITYDLRVFGGHAIPPGTMLIIRATREGDVSARIKLPLGWKA